MPTVDENKALFDERWDWSLSGDEWSSAWGGSDLQWDFTIHPRVRQFLPTGTILEIAPGFGRWTQFLKDVCDRLIVVDLAEKCIAACRERFADEQHLEYHVNDGSSLAMVPDGSVDLVFSFDSLVHVETDVIARYLEQIGRKLTPDGVGVIHHSNLAEHSRWLSRLARDSSLARALFTVAKLHPIHRSWRAASMSADRFAELAERAGLHCISQEKVNWACSRTIDCISTFTRPGSRWSSGNVVIENGEFMREAAYVRSLAPLYSRTRFGGRPPAA